MDHIIGSHQNENWESVWLSSAIDTLLSREEIQRAVRIACSLYENLEQAYYYRVKNSPLYEGLVSGTVADLIVFLRSFRNKSACGYAHETRMRVGEVILTPENCIQKDGYIGCGHPELNGLLLAEVLAEILLDKAHPIRRSVAKIGSPLYQSLTHADTGAALYYQKESGKIPQWRLIPIHPEIRMLQVSFGKIALDNIQEIVSLLEKAYA